MGMGDATKPLKNQLKLNLGTEQDRYPVLVT